MYHCCTLLNVDEEIKDIQHLERNIKAFSNFYTNHFKNSLVENLKNATHKDYNIVFNQLKPNIQRYKRCMVTNSTINVPIRPIIQALEFHISAVNVNPRNAGSNLGSTFGTITFPTKKNTS